MIFLLNFSSPFLWLFVALCLVDIALLFIYIIKKNKTAFYACLAVSVMLIGIVTLYTPTSMSQTKVSTPEAVTKLIEKDTVQVTMKTYSSENYTFAYPKDFMISESGGTVWLKINDTSGPVDQILEVPFVTIEILGSKKDKLIADAATRLNDANTYRNIFNRSVVVGDRNGVEIGNYGSKNSVEAIYKEIFVELNSGQTLLIKDVEMDNIVMNKILSTFKFIPQKEGLAETISSSKIEQGKIGKGTVYMEWETLEHNIEIQRAFLVTEKGNETVEIIAGQLEHFSGFQHEPDYFSVLNSRTSQKQSLKQVGERFGFSVSDGVNAEGVEKGQLVYTVIFKKDGNQLKTFEVIFSSTSTKNLIQLLGVETDQNRDLIYVKIGNDVFVYDEIKKTVSTYQ